MFQIEMAIFIDAKMWDRFNTQYSSEAETKIKAYVSTMMNNVGCKQICLFVTSNPDTNHVRTTEHDAQVDVPHRALRDTQIHPGSHPANSAIL
jgi:hypothetical protein